MRNKDSRITLENQQNDFIYKKSKSNLDIKFNRIAFIFFIFFVIFIVEFIFIDRPEFLKILKILIFFDIF